MMRLTEFIIVAVNVVRGCNHHVNVRISKCLCLLTLACATQIGCTQSTNPKVIGSEVHFGRSAVKDVRLEVANPRKVGDHYFKGSGSIGDQRNSPSDVEVWEQLVTIYVFVELADYDGPKLPVYPKKGARFGTFGQVHEEWREFSIESRLTSEIPRLQVPLHNSIQNLVFLIRSHDEDTGWRLASVPVTEIREDSEHQIPDLMTLPRLADDPNESKYREMLKTRGGELD